MGCVGDTDERVLRLVAALCEKCCREYPRDPPIRRRPFRPHVGAYLSRIVEADDEKVVNGFVERNATACSEITVELCRRYPELPARLQTAVGINWHAKAPEAVASELIEPVLVSHLRRSREFDPEIVSGELDVRLDALSRDKKRLRYVSPVIGLAPVASETTFESGVRLRAATDDEVTEWSLAAEREPRWMPTWHGADVVIEVSEELPWDSAPTDERVAVADEVLLALVLATGADLFLAFTEVGAEGIASKGAKSWMPRERILDRVEQRQLEVRERGAALELWRGLRSSPVREAVLFALRRLSRASGRFVKADRLVDYWVALESLFADDTSAEVTYRASLRIAAFVGDSPEERVALRRQLKESYAVRCKIVHGSRSEAKVERVESETRTVLERAMRRILTMGTSFSAASIDDELLRRSQ
jgi:hypothetical protein